MRDTKMQSVEYLRALAALMVLYYHTSVNLANAYWPAYIGRDYGEAGVEIFFVISGYIMVATTSTRVISPVAFFRRRLIRIVPLYWFFTLLAFGVGMLAPSMMLENRTDPVHLVQSLLFWPHENPVTHELNPFFKIGWTLLFEMYFYFFFAILLLLQRWQARVVVLVAAAFVLFASGRFLGHKTVVADFITSEYWLLFAAGALLAALDLAGRLAHLSAFHGSLLAGAALLCLLIGPSGEDHLVEKAAAGFLVLGLLLVERRGRLPSLRWLGYLGAISYSLYLAHAPVYTFCQFAANRLSLPVRDHVWGPVAVCLTMVAALVASMVVHHAIDVPIRRRLSALSAAAWWPVSRAAVPGSAGDLRSGAGRILPPAAVPAPAKARPLSDALP